MKINLFKINLEMSQEMLMDLEIDGYEKSAEKIMEEVQVTLYLKKKHTSSQTWLDFYKDFLEKETYADYVKYIGNDSVSGILLIERKNKYLYAIAHGQAHFLVRKYCDKDFGLDLAERIMDPAGLKMKHSQTFTSLGKKDITSYSRRRKLDDSRDYGEAFSYMKCKTINKNVWGESVDFGESVRFAFGRGFKMKPEKLYQLTDQIEEQLVQEGNIKLPRYRKVRDKTTIAFLKKELENKFMDYINEVELDDYWLTGVSFVFSDDYKYSLKFRNHVMSGICETLDASMVKRILDAEKTRIGERYDWVKVVFYNEDNEPVVSKPLIELMPVTLEHGGKYYVLYHNEWVEFSESYVAYIKEQVDNIPYEIKGIEKRNETELIDDMVKTGEYIQLHRQNVHIGRYCIEKADLMDDENVIMIKDQHQQSDLVYLIKQATTSLRLAEAGEVGENVFKGRNVCLWMLVKRKCLDKLSDFKSFHLLDALNDFRREVVARNLTPVVWVSLEE